MDINNISNQVSKNLNGAESADNSSLPSNNKANTSGPSNSDSDKVSSGNYHPDMSEHLFARNELEKLNQTSFEKLKTMKTKITEYQAAKEVSEEAAKETEIGKLLNNPEVWGEIANKILR